jgi:hypothetical protein
MLLEEILAVEKVMASRSSHSILFYTYYVAYIVYYLSPFTLYIATAYIKDML